VDEESFVWRAREVEDLSEQPMLLDVPFLSGTPSAGLGSSNAIESLIYFQPLGTGPLDPQPLRRDAFHFTTSLPSEITVTLDLVPNDEDELDAEGVYYVWFRLVQIDGSDALLKAWPFQSFAFIPLVEYTNELPVEENAYASLSLTTLVTAALMGGEPRVGDGGVTPCPDPPEFEDCPPPDDDAPPSNP